MYSVSPRISRAAPAARRPRGGKKILKKKILKKTKLSENPCDNFDWKLLLTLMAYGSVPVETRPLKFSKTFKTNFCYFKK
jgi:hypothetical protein